MVTVNKATLKNFDSGNYTATIEIAGSGKTYLEGVLVAGNLPVVEMLAGRKLAVILFDEHNVKDAVVAVVYIA
jgi:hypothetical protein